MRLLLAAQELQGTSWPASAANLRPAATYRNGLSSRASVSTRSGPSDLYKPSGGVPRDMHCSWPFARFAAPESLAARSHQSGRARRRSASQDGHRLTFDLQPRPQRPGTTTAEGRGAPACCSMAPHTGRSPMCPTREHSGVRARYHPVHIMSPKLPWHEVRCEG